MFIYIYLILYKEIYTWYLVYIYNIYTIIYIIYM